MSVIAPRPIRAASAASRCSSSIMAMFVTSMFVAAGFAAANGGPAALGRLKEPQVLLRRRRGRPRLLPQAAAQDPDFWTQCDSRRRPERRPRPARSTSSGTAPAPTRASGARSRSVVRRVHDRAAAHRQSSRQVRADDKQDSLIDMSTRHVQGRASPGRASTAPKAAKRSRDRHLQRERLPELRVLHRLGEPRPAGRRRARPTAPPSRPTASNRYRTARAGKGCIGDPVRRRATPSTARCTPTTRACWSAARRRFGREKTKDGSAADDRRRSRSPASRPATWPTTAAAAATRRRSYSRRRRTSSSRNSQDGSTLPRVQRSSSRPSPTNGGNALHGQDDHPSQEQRRWTSPTTRRAPPSPPPTSPGRATACSTSQQRRVQRRDPDRCRLRRVRRLRQRLRQRHLLQAAHDRRRQRRDRPPDARRQRSTRVADANIEPDRRHGRDARADRQQLRARRPQGQPRSAAAATPTRPTSRRSPTSASRPRSCRCSTRSSVDNYDCGTRRHADRQRRDRAEVPRPGRHRLRRQRSPPAS